MSDIEGQVQGANNLGAAINTDALKEAQRVAGNSISEAVRKAAGNSQLSDI